MENVPFLPGGAMQYKIARGIGEIGGQCANKYSMCPFNGTQIMSTVSNLLP